MRDFWKTLWSFPRFRCTGAHSGGVFIEQWNQWLFFFLSWTRCYVINENHERKLRHCKTGNRNWLFRTGGGVTTQTIAGDEITQRWERLAQTARIDNAVVSSTRISQSYRQVFHFHPRIHSRILSESNPIPDPIHHRRFFLCVFL